MSRAGLESLVVDAKNDRERARAFEAMVRVSEVLVHDMISQPSLPFFSCFPNHTGCKNLASLFSVA